MIILNILGDKWDDETLIKYLSTVLITFEPMEEYKLEEFNSYEQYNKYIKEYDFTVITKKRGR